MEDHRWLIPLAVAPLALRLRLLQPSATVAGFMVGLAVVHSPQQPQHSLMLLVFFAAGSGATKLTARIRKRRGAASTASAAAKQQPAAPPAGRLRRSARARSPSASPAPAATAHVAASDVVDAKRGRSLQQVLAVGLVPALLCLGQEHWHPNWRLSYLSYLAVCAGDTLASEFGSLAARPPLLIITLRPVAAGTDGGISLPGTLASLFGGALVGACSGTVEGVVVGVAAGGAGSLLDSVLGAMLQRPERLAGRPALWKALNCLVNLLSASVVAAVAPLAATHAQLVLPVLGLLLLLLCAATAELSGTAARKILHLGTSVLIVYTDLTSPAHLPGSSSRLLLLALSATVAVAALLSRSWSSSPLHRFEVVPERPAPGIALYAAAVLGVLLIKQPIDCTLG